MFTSDLSESIVWLVEDDAHYREAVAELVATHVRSVEAFGSVEAVLARVDSVGKGEPEGGWPEVVLLDVNLPGLSGIEGLSQLKSRLPGSVVVMLTIRDDAETIYAALGAGASGYLLKSASPDELLAAIREARAGGMLMQRQVARLVLASFEARATVPDYGLTPREHDTLELLVAGLTMKEVAARMGVSYHTVDTHVRHVYAKLQVRSRGGAVAKALRERIV